MKTEQLIVQYLYSNKKVTLQDIGTFTVSPEIIFPEEADKDTALPPDAISFVCDKRAQQDEGLIAYIMQQTRKIKPLATSDLESYSMLNTQFLNIGKPLVLEGVGTLQKTQAGDYAFTQAGTSHVINEEIPKAVTEKEKETISFASPRREKKSGSKGALLVLLLVLLAGAAIATYYFIHKQKAENTAENIIPANPEDTLKSAPVNDSAAIKKTLDSIAVLKAKPAIPDSNSFYIILKTFTDSAAAGKSYRRLLGYGNKVLLTGKDSAYRVRMPFMRPLSDTLVVKDSLSKFFKANTRVELP